MPVQRQRLPCVFQLLTIIPTRCFSLQQLHLLLHSHLVRGQILAAEALHGFVPDIAACALTFELAQTGGGMAEDRRTPWCCSKIFLSNIRTPISVDLFLCL